ncbi:MAG: putative transporter [Frankiales bacterium]|nr:putative transporter [Frankiales bacterium]
MPVPVVVQTDSQATRDALSSRAAVVSTGPPCAARLRPGWPPARGPLCVPAGRRPPGDGGSRTPSGRDGGLRLLPRLATVRPVRDFRLLAAGQALSWLGNGFQTVALAVAVVLHGGGPGELGIVLASGIVARLLGSLFGGVWADRVQPQRVMIGSDLVRVATVGGTAVMFGTDRYSLPLLCLLTGLTALAGSFFQPAMTALKPMVVPAARRQSANASLSMLQTACSVAGPAAGGLVVAGAGAAAGFAVNAASFLASVVSVALVRARVERVRGGGMFQEMGQGWAEVRSRDWLLSGVLAATVYHVANGVVLVLAQVVAVEQLGGASSAGFIAAAEGLGGFLGAALALRVRPRRMLLAGWSVLPLMTLWVLAYVVPGTLTAVLAGAVVGYAGLIFFDVCWETALQDHVPHQLLARVASWDTLTSFLGMPLGNALAGPLAAAFGTDRVLLGCAGVLLLSSLAPLLVPGSRSLVRPDAEPALLAPT